MGTNCAPVVAELFLFCNERGFMMSLSDDTKADTIEALFQLQDIWIDRNLLRNKTSSC